MSRAYRDRRDAGRELADSLGRYRDEVGVIVLGLPRGGVPVAFEVARQLHAPLDVLVVRKLGHPAFPELAAGAIASGGVRVLNPEVASGIPPDRLARVEERERAELARRERRYRGERPPLVVRDATVIVVDDGLATGATMKAAVQALRALGAGRVVVAVPVAPPETAAEFHDLADEFVCPVTPPQFHAVGQWYADFRQTEDEEVAALLDAAAQE